MIGKQNGTSIKSITLLKLPAHSGTPVQARQEALMPLLKFFVSDYSFFLKYGNCMNCGTHFNVKLR